jgi:hypothetical protein
MSSAKAKDLNPKLKRKHIIIDDDDDERIAPKKLCKKQKLDSVLKAEHDRHILGITRQRYQTAWIPIIANAFKPILPLKTYNLVLTKKSVKEQSTALKRWATTPERALAVIQGCKSIQQIFRNMQNDQQTIIKPFIDERHAFIEWLKLQTFGTVSALFTL